MKRVGLFGGTFDPPHLGHVAVAEDVRDALDLDEVWFVPTRISPHKQEASVTSGPLRAAMLEAAIGERPGLRVSTVELDRDGVSWTVDTLRSLREAHPDTAFFLILGEDQFRSFESWREPEAIARLATIVVVAREGHEPPSRAPGTEVVGVAVRTRRIDVASSEVRTIVASEGTVDDLVGTPVAALIRRHNLYEPDSP